MQRSTLFLAIAVAALVIAGVTDAREARSNAGHRFKGSVEVQYRSNDNIAVAPASGERFDFAELAQFGVDDDEEGADDAIDEDGDGIDDLIDPDADNRVDAENRFTTRLALGHHYAFAGGRTTWNNGLRFASEAHRQRDDLDKFNWAATTGFGFASKGGRHVFRPSLSYAVIDRKDAGKFSSTVVASMGYTYGPRGACASALRTTTRTRTSPRPRRRTRVSTPCRSMPISRRPPMTSSRSSSRPRSRIRPSSPAIRTLGAGRPPIRTGCPGT